MNPETFGQFFDPAAANHTLSDVLSVIASWDDLTPARRTLYVHSVNKVMHIQAVSAPPRHGPARFTCEGLNATLWLRAPTTFGVKSNQAFSNLISACRAVLTRMGLHDAKVPLTPAWQQLAERLPTRERKIGLTGFMQFCSANMIEPQDVTAESLDGFERWCQTRQLNADVIALTRRTASGWNWASANVAGWPVVTLVRRDMRQQYSLPFESYPLSFQEDAQRFLNIQAADPTEKRRLGGLFTQTSTSHRSKPRACKPRTIDAHRHQIRAAAAALVHSGVPISDITSLRDLVVPLDHADAIVQFHYERRKKREADEPYETRPSQLLGIIDTLRQIAKYHCRLPEDDVAELADWQSMHTPRTQGTMNEKNMTRLRALLQKDCYAQMLHLPEHLAKQAEAIWEQARKTSGQNDIPAPLPAARLMMQAAALEILLFCPLRRHNLVRLHMYKDLIRDERSGAITRLLVLAGQTKTRSTIDWPVPEESAVLLQHYIRHYRPVLADPGHEFLFPGQDGQPRNEAEFGTRLAEMVEQEIGAEFNMHLARHFSVVRFLRKFKGAYAMVSRLLGHRDVNTTIRFYSGLEIDAAADEINKLLGDERQQTRLDAATGFAPGPRRRSSGSSTMSHRGSVFGRVGR